MKKLKKNMSMLVSSGIGLGVGAFALESMGQGAIVSKVITPSVNMLGIAGIAMMGSSILGITNQISQFKTKKSKRKKRR